jgi:putative DNA methylase
MHPVKSPRKLIEVALPLDKINEAAAREKSIRHGHPSTLHLWWARRPLAAARAVIFAQMVNDPGYQQGGGFKYGKNKAEAAKERERLFRILEELVTWENTTNERVLEAARAEIRRSWREVCELNRDHPQAAELFNPDKLPGLHDPFAGGGAIPLEAQRLGLEAFASDLNPVAVTINKAMIEIPPRFAGRPPVGPLPKGEGTRGKRVLAEEWTGVRGMAEDVRRYGAWMREEAHKKIGHLYPEVTITSELAEGRPDLKPLIGERLTVIAWLWARTVKSPNPAYSHVEVPLASSFVLSSKVGNEAYVEPVIKGDSYGFTVKVGKPTMEAEDGTKAGGRGANFRCLLSQTAISGDYIKAEGQAGRMGTKLMAVVADGRRGRVFLAPTEDQENAARKVVPNWRPMGDVPARLTGGTCVPYGMKEWGDLFTPRQLLALTTFSDLVTQAIAKAKADTLILGMPDDGRGLEAGGTGATAYGEAVGLYLGMALSRLTDICNNLCRWEVTKTQVRNLFGRQSIPMLWDFAENNVFAGAAGDYETSLSNLVKALENVPGKGHASVLQVNAQSQTVSQNKIVSTDPPYYDNIAYADLSDFFYVWLRRTLKPIYPGLYATLAVPKAEELVAAPYRHGGPQQAEAFFLDGMTKALANLADQAHPAFPVTIYYAFKQSETSGGSGTSSTGWETFLEAVLRAGFALTGTWPMRTELGNRMIGSGTNALASSIILVCQKRPADAATVSRREFIRELNKVLPEALDEMTKGSADGRSPVAPVDLSQAIIGPGMAVFSKYAAVLEADGSPMPVRTALQLINRFLAEDDFDADTQWCLHWFEQYGWKVGEFGQADVLARSKATSVDGLSQAGVVEAGAGSVRLLKWAEYPSDWNPATDTRLPIWEALHHLIRAHRQGGDSPAGALLALLGGKVEAVRQLAYRLYTLCERQGRAEDARAYNELITAWSGIEAAGAAVQGVQQTLFD